MSHCVRSWAWPLPRPSLRAQRARPDGGKQGPSAARGVRAVERRLQLAAGQIFADELQRPGPVLRAAAKQRVDDLKEQVFEEIRCLSGRCRA